MSLKSRRNNIHERVGSTTKEINNLRGLGFRENRIKSTQFNIHQRIAGAWQEVNKIRKYGFKESDIMRLQNIDDDLEYGFYLKGCSDYVFFGPNSIMDEFVTYSRVKTPSGYLYKSEFKPRDEQPKIDINKFTFVRCYRSMFALFYDGWRVD